ncbi:hypothetical protein [Streptomyces sp. NPDC057686]
MTRACPLTPPGRPLFAPADRIRALGGFDHEAGSTRHRKTALVKG